MFIKISTSGNWYYKKLNSSLYSIEAEAKRTEDHIKNGDIVAFADDLDGFAEGIGIKVGDLELV